MLIPSSLDRWTRVLSRTFLIGSLVSAAFTQAPRWLQAEEPPPAPLILDMVHHNPGEARWVTPYEEPQVLKGMGYNGKVYFLFDSPTLAVNWQSVDPEIFPAGSPERAWVDAKAA